ncbi:MAG: 2Fe-2S iron-sulfur cluster-binding protein [Candidatus Rokuibacteriota bacterium]
MTRHAISVTVNGAPRAATVDACLSLLDCLREEWGLTGTHAGCEHGMCGACTVLLATLLESSCTTTRASS